MRLYGLTGYPLGHSFSKRYFTGRFEKEGITDCRYENFPAASVDELVPVLREHPDLLGFNVTIPHKQHIFKYLDEVDPEAAEIGAVNCVTVARGVSGPTKVGDGIYLKGYNTDVYGFRLSLLDLLGEERPAALVLGTGGASRAVAYVLDRLGIPYEFVSRTGGTAVETVKGPKLTLSYGAVGPELLAVRRLVVNTTPLGMFPEVDACPDLPYKAIGEGHFLYDLVYNPEETVFLRQGAQRGARVSNGLRMLVGQAERNWELFGI